MLPNKAVFLDRDGTLVKAVTTHPKYPDRPTAPWTMDELEFEPDVQDAVGILKEAGFLTIIVTNQPDCNNGNVDEKTWQAIHDEILGVVNPDDCFMCKHLADWGCSCRKPLPGMIYAASYIHGIDLSKSFMVGDTEADTGAGRAAGCKTVLVRRPYNQYVEADFKMPNLLVAARLLAMKMDPI